MSEVISVQNLSKAYRIGAKQEVPDTLAGAAKAWIRKPVRNFQSLVKLNTFVNESETGDDLHWALRDVSFTVQEGEVLGIIGHNGAGKTTLLKILSRITQPTEGMATIRGRVSSLLEVGTGFHPELTGRENIYMNGTILGMKKPEVTTKFDEIVDFSGVAKFLDTPIKRYSSGMKVRLAFAVAAHLEPEVLVIDEVLAVGDQEFQSKCLGKMQELSGNTGRTVLFVSHNMAAVRNLCTRCVSLKNGEIVSDGNVSQVIDGYISSLTSTDGNNLGYRNLENAERMEGDLGLFRSIRMTQLDDVPCGVFPCGGPARITIELGGLSPFRGTQVGVIIRSLHNQRIYNFNTGMVGLRSLPQTDEITTVEAELDRIRLTPGKYLLDLSIAQKGVARLEYIENALTFEVVGSDYYGHGYSITPECGVSILDGKWQIVS